jgi:hypothetical protein
MPEFYKYAKRNVDSQVDWATIGANLTKVLNDEVKFIEDKKAEINKNTNKLNDVLNNTPTGESISVNQAILDGADQLQKARLLQDRLLKSGKLNYKQYAVLRQNLENSTQQLYGLGKAYQAQYKDIMDRSKSADPKTRSQYLELFLGKSTEGFSKFNDYKAVLNQNDHTFNMVKLLPVNEKGIRLPSEDPNDVATAQELLNRLTTKYDYFDDSSYLKSESDKLGDVVQAVKASIPGIPASANLIDMITNPRLRTIAGDPINSYIKYEDNIISPLFADPYKVSSVLTNGVNVDPKSKKPYDYTFNEDDLKKSSHWILLKKDGYGKVNPEFTEEQKTIATDYLRNKMRNMLDEKHNIESKVEDERLLKAKLNLMGAQAQSAEGKKEPEFDAEAQIIADLATGQFKSTSDAERAKDWVLNKPIGNDRSGKPVFISSFNYTTAPNGTLNYQYSLSNDLGDKEAGKKYQTTDVRSIVDGILDGMGTNFEQKSKIINKAENILNQYGGSFAMAGPARKNLIKSGQYIEFQPVSITPNTPPANTNPSSQFNNNTKNRPPLNSYEGK